MFKVYPISLGCPKNRVDTERLLGSVRPGVRVVSQPDKADFVFINTCGFMAPAVEESIRTILEQAEEIDKLPETQRPKLIVAGCMPGRYGAEELRGELPEVDLWLETKKMDFWPDMVSSFMAADNGSSCSPGRLLSTGSYAWLKISEGCGQSCSFCTIPFIRGKVKSSSIEFLKNEAAGILGRGVKELILVAQDLCSWGKDFATPQQLESLIENLLPLKGLEWLRLMYLYPAGMTDGLLSFLQQAGPPLLPYFDLPLQHAHPDVLSHMGRPFANSPMKVIERIRKYFPHAALRTSLITGFPGETDEQFETLCQFVEDVRFQNLGVFAYAAEDGTKAAAMPGQIPERVKRERRNRIMEIQSEISRELLEEYQGRSLDILVDEPHPEWPGLFVGRAWFQAPEVDGVTYVSGQNIKPGDLVKADVTESFEYDLNALAQS